MLVIFLHHGDSAVSLCFVPSHMSLCSVPSDVAPCSIFSTVAFSVASFGPVFGSRPQNMLQAFQKQLWDSLNISGTEGIGEVQEIQARTQEEGLCRGSCLSGESSRKTNSLVPNVKTSPQALYRIPITILRDLGEWEDG